MLSLPTRWLRALRSLLRKTAVDAELEEEMRLHLELETERLMRAEGLGEQEARRRALIAFGGVERHAEAHREARGLAWLDALQRDLRQGARALRRRPGFTAAAVLTLGLGIGATTAMFSVVRGILLSRLPFPQAERVVVLCENRPGLSAEEWCGISPPDLSDLAARSRSFQAIGLGRSQYWQMKTSDGAEVVDGGIATPGFFGALGLRAEAGRLLEPGDMAPGAPPVAIVSHDFWRDRLGGGRDIVGRTLLLDKEPVTVVGVLPAGVKVPQYSWAKLWRPLPFDPRSEENRGWSGFLGVGRLRAGVTPAAVRAELATITPAIKSAHFATTPGWSIVTRSLHDLLVGRVRSTLLVFLAAVVGVLLIGCANVANLMLARATARGRELALRAALGAGRGRLLRGLLIEALLLALAGAAVGILLAWWGTAAFRALAPPSIPRLEQVRVNGAVLAFALALGAGTTLLFGLLPALRATRLDLAGSIREGGRGQTARGGRLSAGLVVVELALSLVLLTGAGLLLRSFLAMTAWNPGFDQEHLLTFSISGSEGTYTKREELVAVWQRLEQEIGSVPGVTRVATASAGPLFGGHETEEVRPEGSAARGGPGGFSARFIDGSPSLPRTLGVPLVAGRELDERDAVGAPATALVNQALVRMLWPDGRAVGRHLTIFDRSVEVVGVLRDVPPLRPDAHTEPEIFWSNRQFPRLFSYFVVRTSVPPASLLRPIEHRIRFVDPEMHPANVNTYPQLMADELVRPRFETLLLVIFSACALVLAAIGTYGLLAYLVSQRFRDFGVRLALGAQRGAIVRDILRQGVALAGVGLALGLIGGVALQHVLAHWIEDAGNLDPVTLAGSAAVLLAAALFACAMPALRAGRVDPMIALRAE